MSEEDSPADAAKRGDLTIADRVVDKVASIAALEVDGVVNSGSGLDKVVGRRLPKVTTRTRGMQTRINVDIAVVWPLSAAEVADQVRSSVGDAVSEYVGLQVLAVDVSVVKVEQHRSANRRRVQ